MLLCCSGWAVLLDLAASLHDRLPGRFCCLFFSRQQRVGNLDIVPSKLQLSACFVFLCWDRSSVTQPVHLASHSALLSLVICFSMHGGAESRSVFRQAKFPCLVSTRARGKNP